jgi:hypothetical protein
VHFQRPRASIGVLIQKTGFRFRPGRTLRFPSYPKQPFPLRRTPTRSSKLTVDNWLSGSSGLPAECLPLWLFSPAGALGDALALGSDPPSPRSPSQPLAEPSSPAPNAPVAALFPPRAHSPALSLRRMLRSTAEHRPSPPSSDSAPVR